jgi:hypothetical protein
MRAVSSEESSPPVGYCARSPRIDRQSSGLPHERTARRRPLTPGGKPTPKGRNLFRPVMCYRLNSASSLDESTNGIGPSPFELGPSYLVVAKLLLDLRLPSPCRRPIAFTETLAASAIPPLDETRGQVVAPAIAVITENYIRTGICAGCEDRYRFVPYLSETGCDLNNNQRPLIEIEKPPTRNHQAKVCLPPRNHW